MEDRMKKIRAAYIEWDDSVSTAGNAWVSRKRVEEMKIDRCTTIGFIVKETNDLVTVVNSFDIQGDNVSGDMTIPKSAIRKRRVVSWKK